MATIKDLLNEQINEQCAIPEEDISEECQKECVPNDKAVVPDWLSEVNAKEPFLNERTCEYEVVIEEYGDVGGTPTDFQTEEQVQDADESLRKTGLRIFIDYYDKDVDEGTDEFAELLVATSVKNWISESEHPTAELVFPARVLIAISAFNLDQINSIAPGESDFVPTQELSIGMFDLKNKVERLIRALNIFSKWQQFNMYDVESGTKIYHKNTKRHIDAGEFKELLENFWPAIEKMILYSGTGYTLKPNKIFQGQNNISEGTFFFDENTELSEINFNSYGCEDKLIFSDSVRSTRFSSFKDDSRTNNRVISGFIASIYDIDDDLLAREPPLWYDFVQKYFNIEMEIDEGSYENESTSALGCFLQSLEQDTGLFQTLLNQTISLPEVIADKFTQFACMDGDEFEKNREDKEEIKDQFRGILKEAIESESYDYDDPLISKLEELIVEYGWEGRDEIIDQLTWCGMLALLWKVMECLMGQVSYDEMLQAAVKSALKAMKINHVGKLWGLLPASKQVEIYTIVQENLIDQGTLLVSETLVWPWEAESESLPSTSSNSDGSAQSSVQTRNTLSVALATTANEIIQVLIDVLLSEIGASDLLEYLNSFPGAEIISTIIQKAECIKPPTGFAAIPGDLRVFDVEVCRLNLAVSLPSLPKLNFEIGIQAIIKKIMASVRDALLEYLRTLILTILAKLISYLRSNLCEILADLGSAVWNGNALFDALSNSCNASGTDAGEEAIGDIFSELGSPGTAEQDVNLINNLSTVLSTNEICKLLKGNPDDSSLKIALKIIKYNNSEFLSIMNTPEAIRSFFKTLGNYMNPEELDKLCAVSQSAGDDIFAGASVCGDSAIYSRIQNLRREILEENGTCDVDSMLDKINENTLENVETILDFIHGGPEASFARQYPSIFSTGDPSCPTVQGIFEKDDPGSYISGVDNIEDLLEDIEKSFKRDVYGRKGFFDFAMSVTDGTRLRKQNFLMKNPLLGGLSARVARSFNTDLSAFTANDYYPFVICNKLREDLITYAGEIEFDSTIDAESISTSFSTDDSSIVSNISYTHSSNHETPDVYSIEVVEVYDTALAENEENDQGATDGVDELVGG